MLSSAVGDRPLTSRPRAVGAAGPTRSGPPPSQSTPRTDRAPGRAPRPRAPAGWRWRAGARRGRSRTGGSRQPPALRPSLAGRIIAPGRAPGRTPPSAAGRGSAARPGPGTRPRARPRPPGPPPAPRPADRELQTYLRPQTFPVAIRMLRADEPIPERARRPARDFKKLSMTCQVIDMSRRYGWTIALTREDHIC